MAKTSTTKEKTGETKQDDQEQARELARARMAATGRNDACPCGAGKKYKKCHLAADQAAAIPPAAPPDAKEHLAGGWRLFEQRRPKAAEREFQAALELDGTLLDARVGIGMARLSAGDNEGARTELAAVVTAADGDFAKLRADKVTDAFTRPEAQPYLRAAHALGCLAYDEKRYEEAARDLERVYAVDTGTVGTEARLIAAKALLKLEKPADAAEVLKPATGAATGGSRARVALALSHFLAGSEDDARRELSAALDANPHFGKALLGKLRRQVDAMSGSQPGSPEEAVLYAQTYGDAWTAEAKKFVERVLEERSNRATGAAKSAPGAGAASDAPAAEAT